MTVYVAFSSLMLIKPVVEVFDEKRKADAFAFWYKTSKGILLNVEPREIRTNG